MVASHTFTIPSQLANASRPLTVRAEGHAQDRSGVPFSVSPNRSNCMQSSEILSGMPALATGSVRP